MHRDRDRVVFNFGSMFVLIKCHYGNSTSLLFSAMAVSLFSSARRVKARRVTASYNQNGLRPSLAKLLRAIVSVEISFGLMAFEF